MSAGIVSKTVNCREPEKSRIRHCETGLDPQSYHCCDAASCPNSSQATHHCAGAAASRRSLIIPPPDSERSSRQRSRPSLVSLSTLMGRQSSGMIAPSLVNVCSRLCWLSQATDDVCAIAIPERTIKPALKLSKMPWGLNMISILFPDAMGTVRQHHWFPRLSDARTAKLTAAARFPAFALGRRRAPRSP